MLKAIGGIGASLIAAAGIACAASSLAVQTPWRPAMAPLVTRWAKDVDPLKALPEYPRPQMVRSQWINLNGLWEYAITPAEEPAPGSWAGRILVPFPLESALSGVKGRLADDEKLWYRRTFEVPAGWAGQRILLHFGGVDWSCRVLVNGHEAATHKGGYDGFTADITPHLRPSGSQVLVVSVTDPTDAGSQPRGKQVAKPGGIMYTSTSGIWQTVWMEPVAASHIERLVVVPDTDRRAVVVRADAASGADCRVTATAYDLGKPVGAASGRPGEPLSLPIRSPKLWSPSSPFLYDLRVTLSRGGQVVDSALSYFGMRKIEVGRDRRGVTRLLLNGEPLFQVGFLDQGFWPDGLYTAPTDAALRYDIEMTRKLGMNLARKHVKVEPARWYAWCDRLGLLVWQDMPSGNNQGSEARSQFEAELRALIEGRRNHPSIIMWVVFNEGWGQYDTERLTAWVKTMDPSRVVSNASGWTDKKVGDVLDIHVYPGPGSPKPEPTRAAVLGEFGGLGLGVDGHTWSERTWGYQGMSGREALTRRYAGLLSKVYALRDDPGLSACVYTQTTDVETECNGLMTYDREVLKVDLAAARSSNLGQAPRPPATRELLPTSQRSPAAWRYTTEAPPEGWFRPFFDASSWKEAPGGFGTRGTPGAVVRTEWRTGDIWLRREFNLPRGDVKAPMLLLHHDEDAEVYLNGILAARATGFTTDYEEVEIRREAAVTLQPGRNVLAIHCRQTTGGQYVDSGIIARK